MSEVPPGRLWTVETPKADFGVVVRGGSVVWSAPYGRRWLVGKSLREMRFEVEALGGRVVRHEERRAG